MRHISSKTLQAALLAFLLTVAAAPVRSATLSFDLDHEFSGGTPPEGEAPWVRAVFDDAGSPGSVLLTLDTFHLTDNEFITEWYFNFESNAEPLDIALVEAVTADGRDITTPFNYITLEGVDRGEDSFRADGDGLYDILFRFKEDNHWEWGAFASRFGGGSQATFEITGSGITASSFAYLSSPGGGNGPFPTAAKVQGIGENDALSGWIAPGGWENPPQPAPEPATVLLVGAGMLLLVGWTRRRSSR